MSLRNSTGRLVVCTHCAGSIHHSEIVNHQNFCVETMDCEYEAYGCKHRIPRKEYEQHLRDCSQLHLSLITGFIRKTGVSLTPSAPPLEFVDLVPTTDYVSPSVPLAPPPIPVVNNINYKTAFNTLANQFAQLFSQPNSIQGTDIVKQLIEVFQSLYREFINSPNISPPVRWVVVLVVLFILKDVFLFVLRLCTLVFIGFTTFKFLASTPHLDNPQTHTKSLIVYVVFMCYVSMLIL